MLDNSILYYSALETPDAAMFETDPYGGLGCKDKDTDQHTIGGIAPKGGDAVLCNDGQVAHLTHNLRCEAFEYVRFIGNLPEDHPFYQIPNIEAIGIRTRNFYRPVFATDRHPMRIEWKNGRWQEIIKQVEDDA